MDIIRLLLLNGILSLLTALFLYHGALSIINFETIRRSAAAVSGKRNLYNAPLKVIKKESVESGSGISDNIYLSFWYDCRKKDVIIKGEIPQVEHWSIVPYDIYTTQPLNSWLEKDSLKIDESGNFSAILTTKPQGIDNEIDVSEFSRGLVLIRYTKPADPQKALESMPVIEVSDLWN